MTYSNTGCNKTLVASREERGLRAKETWSRVLCWRTQSNKGHSSQVQTTPCPPSIRSTTGARHTGLEQS